jgi:hypothetical protein
MGATGGLILPDGGGSSGAGGTEAGVCNSAGVNAERQDVFLAFAFDVSASMGSDLQPYYQKALKWDPVAAASKAFFADPASVGLNASLTFFPDASLSCNFNNYSNPVVPMTAITGQASNPFADALTAVEPQVPNRIATPTLAVMQGVISYVQVRRAAQRGNYAIVLVSDGIPQLCPSIIADPIDPVVTATTGARNDGVKTYVIGVRNPSPGPDTVTPLNQIAVAGGTNSAYIVDTGNALATIASFKAAVDQIRSSTISCNVTIPPPPAGQTFNKQRVRVLYKATEGAEPTTLTYDPDCAAANSWKYDNTNQPKEIQLCGSTCTTIQGNADGKVLVEFTCNDVIPIID